MGTSPVIDQAAITHSQTPVDLSTLGCHSQSSAPRPVMMTPSKSIGHHPQPQVIEVTRVTKKMIMMMIGPLALQACRTIPAVRSTCPVTTPLFVTSYKLVRTPATRPICVRRVPIHVALLRCVSRGLTPHRTYPTAIPSPRVPLGTFHTPLRHAQKTRATV
jgi:hypothetical protein